MPWFGTLHQRYQTVGEGCRLAGLQSESDPPLVKMLIYEGMFLRRQRDQGKCYRKWSWPENVDPPASLLVASAASFWRDFWQWKQGFCCLIFGHVQQDWTKELLLTHRKCNVTTIITAERRWEVSFVVRWLFALMSLLGPTRFKMHDQTTAFVICSPVIYIWSPPNVYLSETCEHLIFWGWAGFTLVFLLSDPSVVNPSCQASLINLFCFLGCHF